MSVFLFCTTIMIVTSSDTIKYQDKRIFGGNASLPASFPSQVSMRYNGYHKCSGTIVSPRFVLTAAHCCINRSSSESLGVVVPVNITQIILVAGELYLVQPNDRNSRRIVELTLHPSWHNITWPVDYWSSRDGDIAVLKVDKPFDLDQANVSASELPTSPARPEISCQVSGWGMTNFESKSQKLVYIDLKVIDLKKCNKRLFEELEKQWGEGTICAGYMEGGMDTCVGDSGSGLLCKGFLVGITSAGRGCGLPGFPGVYANVFMHKNWILSHIDKELNVKKMGAATTSICVVVFILNLCISLNVI